MLLQLNKTQSRQSDLAVPKPYDSIDIRNEPWLLNTPLWQCDGRSDCRGKARTYGRRNVKRQSSGQVRTVETQAQGLNVVRAAADLAMRGT